jgi:4-amino-4-deoxychorismate lyase
MCLLIESVKVQNRQLYNIEAHNDRVAYSRRTVFGLENKMDLRDFITLPDTLDDGLFKCRIIYAQEVQKVEFLPYTPKTVRTLRIIHDDAIQYQHKFLNRSCIENLLPGTDADDILVVRQGYVTDTSHANIVFFDGKNWVTPVRPLLFGTKRQILLERGVIQLREIACTDLNQFTQAALINAMLDIGDIPFISMENILPSMTLR